MFPPLPYILIAATEMEGKYPSKECSASRSSLLKYSPLRWSSFLVGSIVGKPILGMELAIRVLGEIVALRAHWKNTTFTESTFPPFLVFCGAMIG